MNNKLDLHYYMELSELVKKKTDSELKLHQFICDNFEQLSFYGIIDIAERTNISKATVGRYLQKIGFTGFLAFKSAIKQKHNSISMPIPATISKKSVSSSQRKTDSTEQVNRYIQKITKLFEQFSNSLNIQDIDRLVELIADPKRKVYVVGPASSGALALHFTTLLKYYNANIQLLPLDYGELPKALLNVSHDSLLVVFSYYRFSSTALKITEYFHSKKANVAVITNTYSHPYGKYCQLQYIMPSHTQSVFHSRMAGFLFIELLLDLIQIKIGKESNFDELETLFSFFNSFSTLDK
ncbi:MurR/RpiR family transcriptional regulator [Vibrio sp. SS-MA-C1-2]|uniref:MurR/RpiR family transcriptional regulator n=1 Tax=Vibrio sp. SS-MA-C1-2 TaxID=2908646 RepID=UPI001F2996BD|nr:MurR/RpiR family transcriptional regulator [Vibrio sp. SS-MA-C1-2]UJF17937.1 MurR/RpiR family transcriptional regulator [Vibrio sp. SS-MA-C1-2]